MMLKAQPSRPTITSRNRKATPSKIGAAKKKGKTLAEMNAELAATREARIRADEANCVKLTGKPRF